MQYERIKKERIVDPFNYNWIQFHQWNTDLDNFIKQQQSSYCTIKEYRANGKRVERKIKLMTNETFFDEMGGRNPLIYYESINVDNKNEKKLRKLKFDEIAVKLRLKILNYLLTLKNEQTEDLNFDIKEYKPSQLRALILSQDSNQNF